jgi:hypothetical protein
MVLPPFMRCPVLGLSALALSVAPALVAESLLPATPLPLDNLSAFRPAGANWQIYGGFEGDPRHQNALKLERGTGILLGNPSATAHGPLATAWQHSGLELDFDFLVTPGTRASLWLQGRYAVALTGAEASAAAPASMIGLVGGNLAPRADAGRVPGLWQHLHLEFSAPRFDAQGVKLANARIDKMVLNEFPVQEGLALDRPTAGAAFTDEKSAGPLMFQAEGGPIFIRSLVYKNFGPEVLRVEQLNYQLYPGSYSKFGEYDAATSGTKGTPARFSQAAVEKNGRFALVFTGVLALPRAGVYQFSSEANDPERLMIDGKPIVFPADHGGQMGTVALAAGAHALRLDYLRASTSGRSAFDLAVEGPGIAPQLLTAPDSRPARPAAATLPIEPVDGIRMQRGFVPYEPKKRLYVTSVGTPEGVHYAYDLEVGSLLRIWRGHFLDNSELWVNRGENQLAKPAGPAITLNAKPTVALIEYPQTSDWPDQPDAMRSSQGYTLEPNGQPVFHARLSTLTISDRIAPVPGGRGLTRTLVVTGRETSWSTWVLLAEADVITPQADGGGWIIGDRNYYLDWPANSAHRPMVRTRGGHQQLVVRLSGQTLGKPLTYMLVW